jgi:hypothetical protein
MTAALLCSEAWLKVSGKVVENQAVYLRCWVETL